MVLGWGWAKIFFSCCKISVGRGWYLFMWIYAHLCGCRVYCIALAVLCYQQVFSLRFVLCYQQVFSLRFLTYSMSPFKAVTFVP